MGCWAGLPRPIWVRRWPTCSSPRSTRASRPRSGCSNASSGSIPRARPRSPAAWPSRVGRSTTTSCSRWSTFGRPAAGPARRAGPRDDGLGHVVQTGTGGVVGHSAARQPNAPADLARGGEHGHRRPASSSSNRPRDQRTVAQLHRDLRRRRRASTRCAQPSSPTCPMGSARRPPAKMQTHRPPRRRGGPRSGRRSW